MVADDKQGAGRAQTAYHVCRDVEVKAMSMSPHASASTAID